VFILDSFFSVFVGICAALVHIELALGNFRLYSSFGRASCWVHWFVQDTYAA